VNACECESAREMVCLERRWKGEWGTGVRRGGGCQLEQVEQGTGGARYASRGTCLVESLSGVNDV